MLHFQNIFGFEFWLFLVHCAIWEWVSFFGSETLVRQPIGSVFFCPDFNGVAVPLSQFREISYPIVNKIARMITKDRDMAIGSFLAKFPKFERWFRIPRSIFKETYLKVGHYLQGKWNFLLLQEFFSGALNFFFSRLSWF